MTPTKFTAETTSSSSCGCPYYHSRNYLSMLDAGNVYRFDINNPEYSKTNIPFTYILNSGSLIISGSGLYRMEASLWIYGAIPNTTFDHYNDKAIVNYQITSLYPASTVQFEMINSSLDTIGDYIYNSRMFNFSLITPTPVSIDVYPELVLAGSNYTVSEARLEFTITKIDSL